MRRADVRQPALCGRCRQDREGSGRGLRLHAKPQTARWANVRKGKNDYAGPNGDPRSRASNAALCTVPIGWTQYLAAHGKRAAIAF